MRLATIVPLFLSSLCLRAAAVSPCPVVQPTPPTSLLSTFDGRGSATLTGPIGDLRRAIALYQTFTFAFLPDGAE